MKLNDKIALVATSILKFPSASVVVPRVVPFTATLTPLNGTPSCPETLPLICCCAKAHVGIIKINVMNQRYTKILIL